MGDNPRSQGLKLPSLKTHLGAAEAAPFQSRLLCPMITEKGVATRKMEKVTEES